MPLTAFFRAALALAATLSCMPAGAGRYSDLWFDAAEPGWGANVVQQQDTAFVTLFVYDPDGKPTWYVASEARIVAYASAGPIFAGTLYRTRGPWHGGPFDPGAVQAAAVGEVSLEMLAADRMRLHYRAEGVARVKEITRQTWQEPVVAANYAGQFVLRQAMAAGPPFGTLHLQADLLLHFEGGEGFMRVDDHLGRRCEYRGAHRQAGKLATLTGQFTCTAPEARAGTFELTDLEVTDHGLTAFLRTQSGNLREYGRMAAARY